MAKVYSKGTEHLTFVREGKDDAIVCSHFKHSTDPFFEIKKDLSGGAFELFLNTINKLEKLSQQIIMEFMIDPDHTTQAELGRKFGISRQAVHDRLQTIKRKHPAVYNKIIREQIGRRRQHSRNKSDIFNDRITCLIKPLREAAEVMYCNPHMEPIDIARELGVSRQVVHVRIKSLKLRHPEIYKKITKKKKSIKKGLLMNMNERTYKYREVAEKLSITPKQIKRLVLDGTLEAIDIRLKPNSDTLDMRHIRIMGDSLNKFIKNRIVVKEVT